VDPVADIDGIESGRIEMLSVLLTADTGRTQKFIPPKPAGVGIVTVLADEAGPSEPEFALHDEALVKILNASVLYALDMVSVSADDNSPGTEAPADTL
jgi:hypothetical protein